MASPEQAEIRNKEGEQTSSTDVGALLKASRLRVGEELRDISAILKIRYVYLEAIEDGRFEDLPGPTYSMGFVRAYAEHLGLDSEEVMRRFKNQVTGDGSETELVFPEPIPEMGIPGGAIVFIGILLAAVVYGVWYVNSSKDGFMADLIQPVPERLAQQAATPEKPKDAPAPEAQPEAEPETKPEETAKAPEPEQTPPAETVSAAVSEPAPEPSVPAEPVAASVPEPAPEPAPVASAPSTPAPEAPSVVPVDMIPPATAVPATPAPEPVPSSQPAAETQTAAVTASEPSGDKGRIVVRAKLNSWIQVRDDTINELLVTRLLRAGDSYAVPGRRGLKLSTGNAGALEILVDGEVVPSIGDEGTVRRNVVLDAERLKAGTATGE